MSCFFGAIIQGQSRVLLTLLMILAAGKIMAFLLVNIGMQLKLEIFRDPSVVAFAVLVTLVAAITKLLGCDASAWRLGWRRIGQVGMGMVPRGEVGIFGAQIEW